MAKTNAGEFEVFDKTLEVLEAKKAAKVKAEMDAATVTEARAVQATLFADFGTAKRQGRNTGERGKSKAFPLLSVAVEQYIKAKIQTGEWKEASKKDIPPCLHQFREVMTELEKGNEPQVDQLTRQHMRDFTALLTRLPYRTVGNKAYAGLSWHEIADKGKAEPRKLSVDTIKNRQVRIRSLLNWIEQEYEGDNGTHVQVKYLNRELTPPKDLRIKAAKEDSSREGFTDEDLEALFKNSDSYRQSTSKYPSRFWSPLVGLFTGMRLEEICQLCLSDIQTVDGVRCFSINDEGDIKHVKTFAGKRLVPVHPFLWDKLNLKGLYEERMGIAKVTGEDPHATLLFSDMHERATRLRAGKQDFRQLCAPASKWFTLFRRARGIGAEQGEKSNQVFHSFRHTLVTYLHKEARADLSMIKAVVGHVEGQEMGITAQYAGEWPVVTLRDEVILKLNWHERFPFLARLAW